MKELKLSCGAVALVDDEDYDTLSQYVWQLTSGGYAMRNTREGGHKSTIRLHREIMQAPKGLEVDHVNGNPLDNRKENLRICTRQQNTRNVRVDRLNNTSGRKGVSWDPRRSVWRARIRAHGKDVHLGHFTDREDAARAYDAASREFHGEFGRQNALGDGPARPNRRLHKSNTNGLRGVHRTQRGRWQAACCKKHIGTFSTPLAAAVAYNIAALQAFGFDAYQNPVFSGEEL